jgi:membrane associated rhomboid family serine protease
VAKQASEITTACYRHPSRETGVSCSNCGNPICPDCMTSTSVGMRCPDCASQKTKVVTAATLGGPPQLTYALIAINVLAFVAIQADAFRGLIGGGISDYAKTALYGPAIADGEWWRIVTSGFMHAGILHIAFNMYVLYWLGSMLEPSIGKLRFGIIYFVSLVGGSFGALLLSGNTLTVGASGAVFGLMGAGFIWMRARGIDPMQSGLGILIVLNLALGFVVSGISIGGHIGGLISGGLVAYLMFDLAERRGLSSSVVYGLSVVLGVALLVGSVLLAQPSPTPAGF